MKYQNYGSVQEEVPKDIMIEQWASSLTLLSVFIFVSKLNFSSDFQ